jgi:hypothetical protein
MWGNAPIRRASPGPAGIGCGAGGGGPGGGAGGYLGGPPGPPGPSAGGPPAGGPPAGKFLTGGTPGGGLLVGTSPLPDARKLVFTGASVCVCVVDILVLSMGEFLISAGMGSFRNWADGAIPSSNKDEVVSASVNAGSSSAAVCGTTSSIWVFS